MANSLSFLAILCLLFFTNSVRSTKLTYAADGLKTWCIAKPSSSDNDLIANINFACGALRYGNCTQIIVEGGPCYQPDVLFNRASVAMNLYYREFGANWWNCDFKNSGLITIKDPSYGNCVYA